MDTRNLLKIVNFYARFTPNYTKIGYGARKLTWPKMPPLDFSRQVWLVTGASSGLGKGMMHAAAIANAEVIGISSNQDKLNAAVAELPQDAQDRVSTIVADLSLQSGTQALVEQLLATGKKFDVLQNNAGMLFKDMQVTPEGRERTFSINVLSHYLLTTGLIDGGAFSSDSVIVNMTSGGMYNAPIGIKSLNVTDAEKYIGKIAYAYSKRAQVVLTDHWNKKYGDRGIRFYVTHPGWTKTPGVKEALPFFWKIQNGILRTLRQGADTALWLCATRPDIEDDVVWFDRKARPTHMYDYTKKAQCTVGELVDYFERELAGDN